MKYMSEPVTCKGYAKINLHLDITGREENGYHSVETVMQSISFFDEVTVRLVDGESFAVCDIEGVPTDRKNLAVKAAEIFLTEMGSACGVEIKIEKSIPMAAGMAGGSADAAATLKALNLIFNNAFDIEKLCSMGAKLGADVPFCIKGGTCFADGKGDILHPFPPMPHCYIVAACGGEGVSTPWAYGILDEKYGGFIHGTAYQPKGTAVLRGELEALEADLFALTQAMYNIFEEPILALRPTAAKIKTVMLDNGAVGAMMSGSGPSVFGIFSRKDDADKVTEAVRNMGYFAKTAEPFFGE